MGKKKTDTVILETTTTDQGPALVCKKCCIVSRKQVSVNGKLRYVRRDVFLRNRQRALEHVLKHHIKGSEVPKEVLSGLQRDLKTLGSKL